MSPRNFLSAWSQGPDCPEATDLQQVVIDGNGIQANQAQPESPVPASQPLIWHKNRPLAQSRREIRLLIVDAPSDSSIDAPVTGRLRVVDLDANPEYRALSYEWGVPPTLSDNINCDGVEIGVTSNCLSAIQYLRGLFKSPLVIWIDAICIDQNSEAGKKHQIPLMGEIYSRASEVIAWLGKGDDETNRAMDYLARGALPYKNFFNEWVDLPPNNDIAIPTGYRLALRIALDMSLNKSAGPGIDSGLGKIFASRWIRRVWTLQEAVLARDLRVVCGKKTVPWLCVTLSVEFLARTRFTLPGVEDWWRLVETWKQHHWTSTLPGESEAALRMERLKDVHRRHASELQRGIEWRLFHETFIWCSTIFWFAIIMSSILFSLGISLLGGFVVSFSAVFIFFSVLRARGKDKTDFRSHYHSRLKADTLLLGLQRRECTKPCDKYLGVQSLLASDHERVQELPDCMSEPLHSVYRLLSKRLVEHTHSLHLLLLAPSKMPHTPSWVVDWRSVSGFWLASLNVSTIPSRRTGRAPRRSRAQRGLGSTRIQGAQPGASHGSETRFDFLPNGRLRVWGFRVGHLSWCSGHIENHGTGEMERLAYLVAILAQATSDLDGYNVLRPLEHLITIKDISAMNRSDQDPDSHQTSDSHRKPHASRRPARPRSAGTMALYASRMRRRKPRRTGRRAQFILMLPRLLALLAGFSDHLYRFIFWVYSRHLNKFAEDWCGVLKRLSDEELSIVRCSSHDRLNAFGPAPGTALAGDTVALIAGVPLPMILRLSSHTPGCYEIVGPAYFHSTMGGGPWKKYSADTMEEFILV